MRKSKAKTMEPATAPAAPDDLAARLAALEKEVRNIKMYPPVAWHCNSIEQCEATAEAERRRKEQYAAAAGKRREHLRDFAGARLAQHPALQCVAGAVLLSFNHWASLQNLPRLECYDLDIGADEVENALVDIFGDKLTKVQDKLVGLALAPDDVTPAEYVASIEAAEAARIAAEQEREARLREAAELRRVEVDIEKAGIDARIAKEKADRYFARKYDEEYGPQAPAELPA